MAAILDQFGQPFSGGRSTVPARRGGPMRPVRARYDVAQTTTDNERHWALADGMSADAANIPAVRRMIRNRARYEVANNSYARGMTRTQANDVVGSGPRLQVNLPRKKPLAKIIEKAWSTWAREIRFASKLWTLRLAQCQDGEGFGVITTNESLRHPVKLDVQTFEAELCTTPFLNPMQDYRVDGIVLDKRGQYPVEYHFLKRHPGDTYGHMAGPMDYYSVARRHVIHLFREERPGQHRGICEILPALPLYAILRRYTVAVLRAAETVANHSVVMQTNGIPAADSEIAELEDDPLTPLDLENGSIVHLPEGWEAYQIKAEQPTTTYSDFKNSILCEIARCINMPKNVALGDSSGYNYSSGRLDHQVYFKSCEMDRVRLEDEACDRVFEAFVHEACLIGLLPMEAYQLVVTGSLDHSWRWDPYEDIDPEKTASARKLNFAQGMTTLDIEYAKQGLDPDVELQRQADRFGITLQELNQRILREMFPASNLPTAVVSPSAPAPARARARQAARPKPPVKRKGRRAAVAA